MISPFDKFNASVARDRWTRENDAAFSVVSQTYCPVTHSADTSIITKAGERFRGTSAESHQAGVSITAIRQVQDFRSWRVTRGGNGGYQGFAESQITRFSNSKAQNQGAQGQV
jgi:hypothetical protein